MSGPGRVSPTARTSAPASASPSSTHTAGGTPVAEKTLPNPQSFPEMNSLDYYDLMNCLGIGGGGCPAMDALYSETYHASYAQGAAEIARRRASISGGGLLTSSVTPDMIDAESMPGSLPESSPTATSSGAAGGASGDAAGGASGAIAADPEEIHSALVDGMKDIPIPSGDETTSFSKKIGGKAYTGYVTKASTCGGKDTYQVSVDYGGRDKLVFYITKDAEGTEPKENFVPKLADQISGLAEKVHNATGEEEPSQSTIVTINGAEYLAIASKLEGSNEVKVSICKPTEADDEDVVKTAVYTFKYDTVNKTITPLDGASPVLSEAEFAELMLPETETATT